ncbi:MAG: hypothetical protein OXC17_09285 [Aestuariivita sp.]|nr:hypothetical protein [Aestuariivita sp.]
MKKHYRLYLEQFKSENFTKIPLIRGLDSTPLNIAAAHIEKLRLLNLDSVEMYYLGITISGASKLIFMN